MQVQCLVRVTEVWFALATVCIITHTHGIRWYCAGSVSDRSHRGVVRLGHCVHHNSYTRYTLILCRFYVWSESQRCGLPCLLHHHNSYTRYMLILCRFNFMVGVTEVWFALFTACIIIHTHGIRCYCAGSMFGRSHRGVVRLVYCMHHNSYTRYTVLLCRLDVWLESQRCGSPCLLHAS